MKGTLLDDECNFRLAGFNWTDFPENLLLCNIIFQYKQINFGQFLSIFNPNLFERSSKFWALFRLPLKGFSWNSMFVRYRQSVWTLLVWLRSVNSCSVVEWSAAAGHTKCILMFLWVTWQRHWYIWLLHVADGYVAYSTFLYQLLVSCSSEITLGKSTE